jgi:TonB-dependent starch-binding outer membrane protein SusC
MIRTAITVALWLGLLVAAVPAQAQTGTIEGTVVDRASGEGLAGATVRISGTQRGAAADVEGNFRIENLQPGQYELVASFVGYRQERQTVTVVSGETERLRFQLRSDALGLDQIVVTAQGAGTARREIGTSVANIDVSQMELAAVGSMSQMLQARAPGVNILPGGGKAGQGSRIVLRGAASISQRNEPLIYVDGVRIDNRNTDGVGTTSSGATWSGIDDINPEDIESIEVIRGAAAATLYGAEAAAGVIQIFTRRGQTGAPQFSWRSEAGILHTPRDWWQVSVFSDWFYDEIVQTGSHHSNSLTASGGTDVIRYFASGTYRGETGVLPESGERYGSARLNLDVTPRQDLTIRMNSGFSARRVQVIPDANNTRGYTINGLVGGPNGQFVNTESLQQIQAFQNSNRFTGGLTGEYRPMEGLTSRLTLGFESVTSDQHQLFPYGAISNLVNGYRSNYRSAATNLNVDFVNTYRTQVTPWLRSTTTIGFQHFTNIFGSSDAWGNDFVFIGLETIGGTVTRSASESRLEQRSNGLFGEQQLAFAERFYITGGLRGDAHSTFGDNVTYQLFPKVDVSYVVSEHDFVPEFFSSLRIRGAYGTAGMQPGTYDRVRTWSGTPVIGAQPGIIPSNIGNQDLKSEVTHEIEAGLDLSFLNDRVNAEATYYFMRTEGALYQRRYAPSLGFLNTQLENIGEVENQGFELALRGDLVQSPNFAWSALFNLGTNKNEVTTLADGAPLQVQWRQWIQEGYPVGGFFGDRVIEHNGEWGQASVLLRDSEGNLPEGWDYIGTPIPTRTIQIGSNFTILRDFTVNVLFDHRGGHHLQSSTLRWLWQPSVAVTEARTQGIATEGPVALACRNPADDFVSINCGRASNLNQGDFVFPADFWKLRELAVTYRIPQSLSQQAGLRSAAVTFAGRNLWRWQKYEGLEAEANYRGDLSDSAIRNQIFFDTPLPATYTVGLNIQF